MISGRVLLQPICLVAESLARVFREEAPNPHPLWNKVCAFGFAGLDRPQESPVYGRGFHSKEALTGRNSESSFVCHNTS